METAIVSKSIQERFPDAIVETKPEWICLKKEIFTPVLQFLKTGHLAFINLHCITAVDRQGSVEVVYHLYSFEHKWMLTIKVILLDSDLTIDSLTSLWSAANWLEREVFDLFGVKFTGHPDLRRILNPDTWSEHPLRKDFKRDGFIPRPVR